MKLYEKEEEEENRNSNEHMKFDEITFPLQTCRKSAIIVQDNNVYDKILKTIRTIVRHSRRLYSCPNAVYRNM